MLRGSHRARMAGRGGQRSPRGITQPRGRGRGGGSSGPPPLPKGAAARSTPTPPPWWPPVRQGHRAAPRAAAPAGHAPSWGPSGPLRRYQSGPTCRPRPRRHLGKGRGLLGGGGVNPGRRAFSPAARDWLRRPDDVSDEPGDSGCVITAGKGGGGEEWCHHGNAAPGTSGSLRLGPVDPQGVGLEDGGGQSPPPA